MKKTIFGSIMSLLAALGISAFKKAKTTATSYYWFQIDANQAFIVGSSGKYLNSQLTIVEASGVPIYGSSTTVSTEIACNNVAIFECAIGFSYSQVTHTNFIHLLKTGIRPITQQTTQTAPFPRQTH